MGLDVLALRTLAARPLRTILTVLGVALGVGVLGASLALGRALDRAVDDTVRDVVGRADLRVSAFLQSGLTDETVATIAATPGVAAVAPTIEKRTFFTDAPNGQASDAVTVLGIDPATYDIVHDLTLVAGSRIETASEPVALISAQLADQDGYTVGSPITLRGAGEPQSLRVVGILRGAGPIAGTGRAVVVPIDVARAAFAVSTITRVDLQLAPGATVEGVTAALARRLTSEPYVLASPGDIARGLRATSADFQATAALIAAVVLFVGAFLIINTLSMTVGERAREVGLLRAAGATRTQVTRFVMVGAIFLGILGSILGLAVGAGLAILVSGTIGVATGLSTTTPELGPTTAGVAFLVGIAVTILAAIEPAVRAAQISPFEALRARFDHPAVSRGRVWWIGVVFALVAGLALLAWPPELAAVGAERAMVVYAVLLVATLLSPFLLRPLGRVLALPVALVLRLEERLARGSLARDRSRTALTVGSLVIGLAMIVALGWTAQAARSAATAWLRDVIPGDEVVTSIRPVALDEPTQGLLAGQPGVAMVTPIGGFDVAFRGLRLDASAVVGADLLADGRLVAVAGDRRTALLSLDQNGSVVIPVSVATRFGLHVGDLMPVTSATGGTLSLRVAAVVEHSIPASGGEAVLVGWSDATSTLGVTGASAFAVRFVPGAEDQARAAVRATARTLALESNDIERIQGAVTDALSRIFTIFDALALVAVLVAALGIVNTLTMGVVERVREIGLLRAIGMGKGQVVRMVMVEALVIGLVGSFLGAVTGLGVGAVLLQFGIGFRPLTELPTIPVVTAATIGILLPVLAAFYPSGIAARLSIVRALKFE
jgi:putative ABC transport system permease protein